MLSVGGSQGRLAAAGGTPAQAQGDDFATPLVTFQVDPGTAKRRHGKRLSGRKRLPKLGQRCLDNGTGVGLFRAAGGDDPVNEILFLKNHRGLRVAGSIRRSLVGGSNTFDHYKKLRQNQNNGASVKPI